MIAVNVAQLLKSAVGATRDFEFSEREPELERSVDVRGPVSGRAHLVRTGLGILVHAEYRATVELVCGRCLETFLAPLSGEIDEEFLPRVDVVSGEPLALEGLEGDEPRIDEDHVLDLTEVIRQDILVRVPLQPLCKETCQGLCPECGAVRERQPCACRPAARESPFQALSRLLDQEPPTESEGSPRP